MSFDAFSVGIDVVDAEMCSVYIADSSDGVGGKTLRRWYSILAEQLPYTGSFLVIVVASRCVVDVVVAFVASSDAGAVSNAAACCLIVATAEAINTCRQTQYTKSDRRRSRRSSLGGA